MLFRSRAEQWTMEKHARGSCHYACTHNARLGVRGSLSEASSDSDDVPRAAALKTSRSHRPVLQTRDAARRSELTPLARRHRQDTSFIRMPGVGGSRSRSSHTSYSDARTSSTSTLATQNRMTTGRIVVRVATSLFKKYMRGEPITLRRGRISATVISVTLVFTVQRSVVTTPWNGQSAGILLCGVRWCR